MRLMSTFNRHPMLPELEHDESARQAFVRTFRGHLAAHVMPGNYQNYAKRIEPEFRAQAGRAPADQYEVRRLMERDSYYQFWSAMQRRSQELLWESVVEPTERQLPRLIDRARALSKRPARGRRKGSLRLEPSLPIPDYHTTVDIHLQPGGYHTDFAPDDVTAGAAYDNGIYLYLSGALGPENNSMGDLLVGFFRERFPDRDPRRILDMGCAIGNSTLRWGRAFPKADLHAIDVGAPVLRYGHARAEALGVAVHFSQQNAERTDFEAGSFDLVVSHIMLHETSKSAIRNVMAECHRLLRPGGLMLHLEIPRGRTPLEKFMHNWESYNNNETFSRFMTEIDLAGIAVQGGFAPDRAQVVEYTPRMSADQLHYSDAFSWKIVVGHR
jgi:2-polyprenyl-3-methyl-5-hydroxy-6-metoxy-1,4-benzoquinol methylase